MRLLIVEDDPVLSDGLSVGLGLSGFTADPVGTLADARAALRDSDFAAVVLDVMLPDGMGTTLLAEMRAPGNTMPVLLLTQALFAVAPHRGPAAEGPCAEVDGLQPL